MVYLNSDSARISYNKICINSVTGYRKRYTRITESANVLKSTRTYSHNMRIKKSIIWRGFHYED